MLKHLLPCSVLAMAASLATSAQASDGLGVFRENCIACHQAEGKGTPGLAPALVGPHWSSLSKAPEHYILQVLASGLVGKVVVNGEGYNGAMPSFKQLSAQDVAAVANYVLALNQVAAPVAPLVAADVSAARDKNLKGAQVRILRHSLVKD